MPFRAHHSPLPLLSCKGGCSCVRLFITLAQVRLGYIGHWVAPAVLGPPQELDIGTKVTPTYFQFIKKYVGGF